MDSVTIDGVVYTRASALAKKFGYTNDYIGQLCRSKKVDAHLVGRTWYVYQPSLESHKETRYAEVRSNEITSNSSFQSKISRLDVESPVKKTIVKSMSDPKTKNFQNHVYWRSGSYETDDSELIPTPKRSVGNETTVLPINPVGTKAVRVASRSSNVTMTTEPMPAIALAGTLKVLDFTPDLTSVADNNIEKASYIGENNAVSDNEPAPEDPEVSPTRHLAVAQSADSRPLPKSTLPAFARPRIAAERPHSVAANTKKPLQIPRAVVGSPQGVGPEAPARRGVLFHLVVTPLVIIILSFITGLVLSVESVTNVSPADQQVASLRFDISTWQKILPW